MKSVQICSKLLEPFRSKDGQKKMEFIKEVCPPMYKDLTTLEREFNIIYNDLLKFKGFIAILKLDRNIYQQRIEYKRKINKDVSIEVAILNRIKAQFELLGEED